MVHVTKGDFIWVEPPKGTGSVPIGARVIDSDHGKLKVVDDYGKEEWLSSDRRVKLMHPTSVQGVEDMTQLGDLHEAAILRNISIRYREKLIYTYTGSILIAVNPYMDIPLYTPEQVRLYRHRKIGELPPHIFAVADNAYTNMRNSSKNQSVVISGESGAGKTESTKLVLQFLATISGQHSWIEQQVLEANPILEAFGNAKTIRNDNSSRFGKYIDVHFNSIGAIEGARIEQYLLEKSRIVAQSPGERNYHVFYCLLAGLSLEEKQSFELTQASDYFYLTQGKTLVADGRDDAADFADIRSAMKVLMFKDPEVNSIFRILSALLHTGNVRYRSTTVHNMEAVEVANMDVLKRVARLLNFDEKVFFDALTTRTIVTREERVISTLSPQQAVDTRDALVKGIYGRIFVYIVQKINDAIYKPRSEAHRRISIGILDIFGFENFDTNSFEQLCINYANEHLQQFFVHHIFKMEQKEYDLEKINWRHIQFVDNQETLDLIAQRPMNIMSLIDEESIFPKGTDDTMLQKLHTNHNKNDGLYLKPKSDLEKAFGVTHFAGAVYYSTKGFLEKNRDTFSADLHGLIATSKMSFLMRLFDEGEYMEGGNKRKGATVGGQFKKSLETLMGALQQTEPFFIRCIKPNEFKKPMYLDRILVIRQLRYSGMMETIKIRKAGYPVRHGYQQFVDRYRVLVNGIPPSHRVDCFSAAKKICLRILGAKADFQLGKTKIFLKDAQDLFLEQEYFRMINERATVIQKAVKGWVARKRFIRQRQAAVLIQKTWRGFEQRKRYKQIIAGITRLQAWLRAKRLEEHYQNLRATIIRFQAHCRGALVRNEVRAMRAQGKRKPAMMAPIESSESEMNVQAAETEIVTNLFDFLPTDGENGVLSESNTMTRSTISTAPSPSVSMMEDLFNGEDLSKYQFGKFAATYFQAQATSIHVKRPIKFPLLSHDDPSTQLAAMAVWMTMLRFMGDLPDIKLGSTSNDYNYDKTPVMTKLYTTLGRKFSRRDVEEASLASEYDQYATNKIRSRNVGKKLISMTLKKKSKLIGLDSNASEKSNDSTTSSNHFNALLDNKPMSSLDKLHYIIGLGILREEIRDEIYCQLCKQLSNNPSKLSQARGWILMSLCVGCFAPSERFLKYLFCFIREQGPGNSGYAAYIEQRLRRTQKNGTRHQPPSYVELQANKSKKDIVLAITFMDGSVKSVHADSATTAAELCEVLAEKVHLKDRFGFSLYIALFDKVSSLGSGCDHVLDAVSQCEQYAKEQGNQERNAPWRLFFRKEIFSPWYNPKEDPVATNLIYQQVVRGVKFGEYRCEKDEDYAVLAAQNYIVDEGALDVEKLRKALTGYLPDFVLNGKDKNEQFWLQMVMNSHRKKFGVSPQSSIQSVKEDVVGFAKFKWPLLFSRFYEAKQLAGPPLENKEVIIAVNYTGIYVVDDKEQVLQEFSFPEVAHSLFNKGKRSGTDTFTIRTVTGDDFIFQSPNSEDVAELVEYFLMGLKERSKFLIATQTQKGSVPNNSLEFDQGDLLILTSGANGATLKEQQVILAENARTGLQGYIRADQCYVLPTMNKPANTVMELFPKTMDFSLMESNSERQVSIISGSDLPHTLEKFAQENFKLTTPNKRSTLTLRRNVNSGEIWRFSRDPIREPLLRKLDGKKEPSIEAMNSYIAIMKYMGDYQTHRSRLGTDITDQIFRAPLKYEVLRDECYCQIMKQLTLNPSLLSEERGWELLWLLTGLFPPSQHLHKEVLHFLKSRMNPISNECYHRVHKMLKAGARKYPPYSVEVEAIQNKTVQILHKVYFPDHTNEGIELDSSTKAKDFCQRIGKHLKLKDIDGFSLFLRTDEKILSVPEDQFFFDFIRQLSDWAQENYATKDRPYVPLNYQVYFMRKLWLNVKIGDDEEADLIFHYHQELPKYLSGYHKISKQEAIEIGALILRARTRQDQPAPIPQLHLIMSEIVPQDLIKAYNGNDWKKHIKSFYTGSIESMSCDSAKIAFLEKIRDWPTFGSTFFLVKQTADQTLPTQLLVAINRNGVSLYHPETKDQIANYPFTQIGNWTIGNTYINITVGNLIRGSSPRLTFETEYGYKMDDLLKSYISVLISAQTKNPKLTSNGNAIM
ncbi:unnamed protein product, partial [Mesorhabditis belari]|uniref:Myosin-VIIa n=1 Tax=Mesorhabditis belari TaxID=2138241 RepID=A0AAF3FL91_9BILA